MELREYLEKAVAQGASDLFIVAGLPLTCKVNGKMVHMSEERVMPEETERLILVGVQEQAGDDTEDSVCELGDLVRTAGGEPVGTVIQRREKIHPGTYVGTGKIEELRMMADALEATGIVCDDELSPAQMNNLQQDGPVDPDLF